MHTPQRGRHQPFKVHRCSENASARNRSPLAVAATRWTATQATVRYVGVLPVAPLFENDDRVAAPRARSVERLRRTGRAK